MLHVWTNVVCVNGLRLTNVKYEMCVSVRVNINIFI
jgi:hypothetical protein